MSASPGLHSSASLGAGSAALAALALECRGICKTFPGVVALDHVDLAIRRGEIHGLVGQNGAGKSTLVKILTGVYAADEGEILLDGAVERVASPNDAAAHGIAIVHQDQQLVPLFDVTRNIFLGCEKVGFGGLLDLQRMHAETATLLAKVGASFGPDTLIRDLSVAEREQVAIASALLRNPRILILDEPTASLSSREVEHLFGIIRALRDNAGVTVIYISHYIPEVFRLVDRISVFRDGRLVQTLPAAKTSPTDIIQLMVGGELRQLYPKEDIALGEVGAGNPSSLAGQPRTRCQPNAAPRRDPRSSWPDGCRPYRAGARPSWRAASFRRRRGARRPALGTAFAARGKG